MVDIQAQSGELESGTWAQPLVWPERWACHTFLCVSHWAMRWDDGAESLRQGLTGLTFCWRTPMETSHQGHFR